MNSEIDYTDSLDFAKATAAIGYGMSLKQASRIFKIPLEILSNIPIGRRKRKNSVSVTEIKEEISHSKSPLVMKEINMNLGEEENERLCRLCLESENEGGESFERIFGRTEIAAWIFALTGVQVKTIMIFL